MLKRFVFLAIMAFALWGCSININTQKPKTDTIYVEKYWGSDVSIPTETIKYLPWYATEIYPTYRNNLPEDTIGIFRCYGSPPSFEDYNTRLYFDTKDNSIYFYRYRNKLDVDRWKYH